MYVLQKKINKDLWIPMHSSFHPFKLMHLLKEDYRLVDFENEIVFEKVDDQIVQKDFTQC